MNTRQRFDAPLKIKSVSETGEFSGYGSVFGVEDSYGDVVVRGAFEQSLADHEAKGRLPALLWQHRIDEPIGVYTKMVEDDDGLYVEGRLLIDDDPQAKRAHAHMKAGSLSGLSIGYTLPSGGGEYDKEKDVFVLSEIDLWEVSLVTFPANDDARVQDVKSALAHGEVPAPNKVERLLRDAGFSRRQAKQIMAEGYKALAPRDAGATLEDVANLTKRIRGLTNA
jgi:HK97 family phage prohead protease